MSVLGFGVAGMTPFCICYCGVHCVSTVLCPWYLFFHMDILQHFESFCSAELSL